MVRGSIASELRESYRPWSISYKWLICILSQLGWYVDQINNPTLEPDLWRPNIANPHYFVAQILHWRWVTVILGHQQYKASKKYTGIMKKVPTFPSPQVSAFDQISLPLLYRTTPWRRLSSERVRGTNSSPRAEEFSWAKELRRGVPPAYKKTIVTQKTVCLKAIFLCIISVPFI